MPQWKRSVVGLLTWERSKNAGQSVEQWMSNARRWPETDLTTCWIDKPRNRWTRRRFGRRCAAHVAANGSLPSSFPRAPERYGMSEEIDAMIAGFDGTEDARIELEMLCDQLASGWPELITKIVVDSLKAL